MTLKMSEVDQVVSIVGCTREVAEEALHEHKDVISAIDALLTAPPCRGAVYIPPKPMIDTGMSKEQEERCLRGRKVTDTLNAVQTTAYRLANQQVAKAAASTVSALAPPAQTLSSEPHSGS
jgi:hypothetical protein